MPLSPGTRLGPHEILAPLGAGGMGEVYRARDSRLGREVAIKVLPQHLSADPEVRARFEREARTVSGLNHPNICTLYDVGREGDTDYLVMELVEGETLAERLRKGPLSAPELLRIAGQIADALDRAHRAGVIHRDLKPGNVMLTRSGAKLMDFGLARATGMGGAASGSGATVAALTQSPTVARPLTAEGTIVGTFQYMAPEQLEGREADARSDIWALGCVLYEMATGKRAFEGRSQASLIAAILEREVPAIGEAPSGSGTTRTGPAPAGLDRLVRACLVKDPEERIQTAHDVKLQLQWIAEGAGVSSVGVAAPAPGAATTPGRRGAGRIAWGVAGVAVLAAAAALAWAWQRARVPVPDYRFLTEALPGVPDYFWPRLSPDGRYLVFESADSAGTARAWLRPMNESRALPIVGTEGLRRAYWSPDSRELAFLAAGKIQRLPITGGTPTIVCEAQGGADVSWGSKGQILMDGTFTDSLKVVPARGGELRPASRIDRSVGETGSAWPCFLPDGEHFLFIGNTAGGATGNIRLGRLGSLDSKLLGRSDGRVEYAPGGWVLYIKGATLLAQRLDLRGGRLTGQPLTITENLRMGSAAGHYTVSRTGVLAWSRGAELADNTLYETDRAGRHVGGAITSGPIADPALSPDGRQLLFEKLQGQAGAGEVWVRDLIRGTETRLDLGGGSLSSPVWSPDGRRFAGMLSRTTSSVVLIGSADGLGGRDSLQVPSTLAYLTQWATSGSRILVVPADFSRVLAASMDSADRRLRPIEGAQGILAQSVLSPDGRWLACASGQSVNRVNVFVQSLTGTPGRWQISTAGGYWPHWTRGGRELVYEAPDGIMAVDIDTQDGFRPGTPRKLFDVPIRLSGVGTGYWTVSPDGNRFFVLEGPRQRASGEIEVVTDFSSLVNRR